MEKSYLVNVLFTKLTVTDLLLQNCTFFFFFFFSNERIFWASLPMESLPNAPMGIEVDRVLDHVYCYVVVNFHLYHVLKFYYN